MAEKGGYHVPGFSPGGKLAVGGHRRTGGFLQAFHAGGRGVPAALAYALPGEGAILIFVLHPGEDTVNLRDDNVLKNQRGHRRSAVGCSQGFSNGAAPGGLLFADTAVTAARAVLQRIHKVQIQRRTGAVGGIVEQMVGAAARKGVSLVLRQTAGKGAVIGHLGFFVHSGILGVVVAENHGEGNVSLRYRREDLIDDPLYIGLVVSQVDPGMLSLYLVPQKDNQIRLLRVQHRTQVLQQIPGYVLGGLEIGKYGDFQLPILREAQRTGLPGTGGGRQQQEERQAPDHRPQIFHQMLHEMAPLRRRMSSAEVRLAAQTDGVPGFALGFKENQFVAACFQERGGYVEPALGAQLPETAQVEPVEKGAALSPA